MRIINSRARFDYELLEKFEAGLVLSGFEVKALKSGRGALAGSHVVVRGNEAYLVGAEVAPYQANNLPAGYERGRSIKLLLTKKELAALAGAEKQKGLTIVPLEVYNRGRRLKLRLAIARGKKKYDKRETIKRREGQRQIERTLKARG
jgi:SsrA-binding protein